MESCIYDVRIFSGQSEFRQWKWVFSRSRLVVGDILNASMYRDFSLMIIHHDTFLEYWYFKYKKYNILKFGRK